MEVHPPQIYYLHALPVLLSWATNWSIVFSFNLIVSLLALFSGFLFGVCAPPGYRTIAGALWASSLLLAAHDYFFGQREYFFVLAWMPYLLSRTGAGAPPRRAQITSGALLGFLICVKPHFALIAAGTEAWLWLRWRAQCRLLPFFAFVAVGALQVVIFLVFFDFDAYRHGVQMFNRYYEALGLHYLDTLFAMLESGIFLLSLLGALMAMVTANERQRPFMEAGAATIILGIALAVLQGTFRPYYVIPMYFPAMAMLIAMTSQSRQDMKWRRFFSVPFAYGIWMCLAGLCLVVFAYQPSTGILRLAGKRYVQGYQYPIFGGIRPDPFADWVIAHVPLHDVVSIIAPQYGLALGDPIISMLHLGRPVLSRATGLELIFSVAEATGDRRAGCEEVDDIRRDLIDSNTDWLFIRREMPPWASAGGVDPLTHFQHYPSFWRWFNGSFSHSDQFGKYAVYRRKASFTSRDRNVTLGCP